LMAFSDTLVNMKILNAEFVKSIVVYEEANNDPLPEVCFIGRSNVGKSSMINNLVMRKVARTSSTPGATKLINIFNIYYESKKEKKSVLFSDFPGFGFSKVSRTVSRSWQAMIENYILKNKKIRTIIWLFDIRREIDELDEMLIEWLLGNNLKFCVVLTKCDKETQGAIVKKKRLFDTYLKNRQVFTYSSKTGLGKGEILSYMANSIE
jgi:GTP-binding protein